MDEQIPSVFGDADPVGQGDYEVRTGDCLHSIAADHGFFWKTIWEHSENSDVREKREDPMVILPGDRLTIPERTEKTESGEIDAKHRFLRKGVPAKLKLEFLDDGEPLANKACVITIDGDSQELETDDNGRLEFSIPPGAKEGRARLRDGDAETVYELDLGHLDPYTQIKGVQQRLQNLGLYQGAVDGSWSAMVESAIEAFRSLNDLEDESEPSLETLQAIRDAHGS